jgi:hypothetical protein
VNYDDSVLYTTNVIQGQTAVYVGATPTRPATSEFTYVFTGWDRTLTNITSAYTTKAQFSSTTNAYTVTWQNHDGTVLETDSNVPYGTTPTYHGVTPTKIGGAQYSYTFTGWSPTVTSVTSNATYIAQFSSTTNAYTVTWQNHDGTVLETDTNVPYGSTPTYDGATPARTGSAQFTYAFTGWSPSIVSVTGDVTYTAIFNQNEGTEGLLFTFHTNFNGYLVSGYNGASEVIYVPEIHLGKTVFAISDYGLANQIRIKKVILSNSVWGIGLRAFENCTALEEIVMPNVTHIYNLAFLNNISLKEIEIPSSTIFLGNNIFEGTISLSSATVNGLISNSTSFLFQGASSLKTLVVKRGSISSAAFGTSGLTLENVEFGENVTYIDNFLFYRFRNTLRKLTINSPITVNSSTFEYTPYLEELELGEKILAIDANTFSVRKNTLRRLAIYSPVRIEDDYLNSASKLESIIFGSLITYLGKSICQNCSSLKAVTILDGPTQIGQGAFLGSSLTSIIIPKSIIDIDSYAFGGQVGFSSETSLNIFYSGSIGDWNNISIGGTNDYLKWATKQFQSNVNSLEFIENDNHSYVLTNNLEIWHLEINDTTLETYDFSEFSNYKILSIASMRFLRNLKSLVLPSTLKTIEASAFSNCVSLETLIIPLSVTTIKNGTFEFCSKLTIYVEAQSKPSGWLSSWNSGRPVVWGYTGA